MEARGPNQGWIKQLWPPTLPPGERDSGAVGSTCSATGLRLIGHLPALPWPLPLGLPTRTPVQLWDPLAGAGRRLGAGGEAPLRETLAGRDLRLLLCLVALEKQGEQARRKYGAALPNPHFLSRRHARAPGA